MVEKQLSLKSTFWSNAESYFKAKLSIKENSRHIRGNFFKIFFLNSQWEQLIKLILFDHVKTFVLSHDSLLSPRPFCDGSCQPEIQAVHIKWIILAHRITETFREFLFFSLQKLSWLFFYISLSTKCTLIFQFYLHEYTQSRNGVSKSVVPWSLLGLCQNFHHSCLPPILQHQHNSW